MVADPKSHKYRFLFLITILMIVFLLVGGDKSTQDKDIDAAKKMAEEV